MASTGEVAAFGKDIQEAYWASLLSTTGFKKPRPNTGVLIGGDITKPEMKTIAQTLLSLGFKLYCSSPVDRKSTRLNSSHSGESRMPSSA